MLFRSGLSKDAPSSALVFSYIKPKSGQWVFDKANDTKTNIAFQYNGTPTMLSLLNNGIKSDDDAKGRIEWPDNGIMHNKFMVFEKGGNKKSVWTGTANVAETCMGTERNSNVGVFIDNTAVAEAIPANACIIWPTIVRPPRKGDETQLNRSLRAVAKVESGGNASAVSHAGAKGLMQLMDGTARSLGVTDSFDPGQNAAGGAKYLRQMLNRFG